MKTRVCKREKCWDYCSECNGGRLIIDWEPKDKLLSNEKRLEMYMEAIKKYSNK
jgi:hypothetical protein